MGPYVQQRNPGLFSPVREDTPERSRMRTQLRPSMEPSAFCRRQTHQTPQLPLTFTPDLPIETVTRPTAAIPIIWLEYGRQPLKMTQSTLSVHVTIRG